MTHCGVEGTRNLVISKGFPQGGIELKSSGSLLFHTTIAQAKTMIFQHPNAPNVVHNFAVGFNVLHAPFIGWKKDKEGAIIGRQSKVDHPVVVVVVVVVRFHHRRFFVVASLFCSFFMCLCISFY
jgi:hypothetical protein